MSHEPFLTVITRTMGTRATLVDTLTTLAAQDDDDFEVRHFDEGFRPRICRPSRAQDRRL